MAAPLETEIATYNERKDELLGEAEGKYVLIHDGTILGTFESEGDAIADGYETLGNVPFLVKHIVRVETPIHFTSNMLAA